MPVEYGLSKAKLPKGSSYPLGRTKLDAALEAAGVTTVHVVNYMHRRTGTLVLWSDYCGEGRKGWAAAGLARVNVYSVPSAERKAAEQAILDTGLRRLVDWLVELERAGNVRRGADQHFGFSFAVGEGAVFHS